MMRYGFGGAVPGHPFGYDPFGGLMIVGFILFAALIGIGLWALLRKDHSAPVSASTVAGEWTGASGMSPVASAPTSSRISDPLEIVRERLARGEIDVAQYTEIVAALQSPQQVKPL